MPSASELTLFYYLTAHKYRLIDAKMCERLTSEAKWAVVSVTEKVFRLT